MKNLYYDILRKKLEFEEERDYYNQRNFLMCNSCFWCASFVNSRYRSFSECPACMDSELESMPISLNERYTFDHDPQQGLVTFHEKLFSKRENRGDVEASRTRRLVQPCLSEILKHTNHRDETKIN